MACVDMPEYYSRNITLAKRREFILGSRFLNNKLPAPRTLTTLQQLNLFKRTRTKRGKRGGVRRKSHAPQVEITTNYPIETQSQNSNGKPKEMSTQTQSPNQNYLPPHTCGRKSEKTLKILNINCQSIKNKCASFLNIIENIKPDIIIGTESWLDPSIKDNEYFPPTYIVHRKDRNLHGGGVFIAIHNKYISSVVSELDDECEMIWAKMEVKGCKTLYVCSYYRPSVCDEESLQIFSRSIEKFCNTNNGIIIIGGDFNFPGWNWKQHHLKDNTPYPQLHQDFMSTLNDCALTQLIEEPTRHENTLDLMITNVPSLVYRQEVVPGISDHDAVYIEMNIDPKKNKQKQRNIPLYKKANWNGLKADMAKTVDEIDKDNKCDVERLWLTFKNALEKGIKDHIPHKLCKLQNSQPWINNNIRQMIKRRDRFYKKFKTTNDPTIKEKYKLLKHKIQRDLRTQYWNYIEDLFSPDECGNCYSGMKKFWSFIKHRKTDNNGIAPIKKNGKLLTSAHDRATALNEQFQSVFSKKQPLSLKQLAENKIWDNCSNIHENQPVIAGINVSEEGVTKLLKGLNPAKASGPDNIQSRVLKELAGTISPCLCKIFQKSLDTGEIPNDWKTANVAPIYKKGQRDIAANYRPISLTCITSKILEHIVVSHIMKYADKHGILYELQHGFRSGRSCETQLVSFIDDVSKSLEKGHQTDVLIMDFSKAFDKVDHNLLCHKLYQYGINGNINKWIGNFLNNRTQSVVVEGESSGAVDVESGVPQGSVLGPTLFLFYINDLAENLSSKIRLFADDTIAYLVINSMTDTEVLQSDLDRLAVWEKNSRMEFHPEKCNVISISRKRDPILQNYTLHGHLLEHVTSAKYLGITINSNLNWDEHINNTTTKANKTLGFLRRNLKISSKNVKEKAYNSLVRPLVEYASTVWDPYTKAKIHQLEMVQRRGARFVTGRHSCTSSVSEMLDELGWQSLEARRRTARLTMFYKIRNNLVAASNPDLKQPTRFTRNMHCHSYIPLSATKNYRKFSFYPRTTLDWNKLPENITSAPSLQNFSLLLSNYMSESST